MHSNNSKETANALIDWLRNYASSHIDSYQADVQGTFPPHVFLDLGNQGFFGMHISQQYGGLDLKLSDMLRVIEQFAAIDLTLTTVIIESIQGAHTLEKYASPEMKKLYLNRLAKGRLFMAGAMTESAAGSNPRSMKSHAILSQDNKWLINGSKRWVGLGNSAELIAIYVQQLDTNNNWVGMSGFLVPKDTQGLRIGAASPTMGLRGFSKHTIYLEDIEVSSENLLGKSGEGMEIAQDNMMFIRLCLAAASIGAMKRCVQLMSRYAEQRIIVTGLLLENPVTLVRLSEMTAIIDALGNLIYTISSLYDNDSSLVPEEAFVVSKILGSEYLGIMADLLVQTLGARGYEEGSGISQIFRDARVFRIFEGPTEALNMYLGSRVLDKNLNLEKFICKTLNQHKLFEEIKQIVEKVNIDCRDNRHLFAKPFSGEYWAQALVGEIVTYGLLLAITEYSFIKTDSQQLYRASLWARNKYNQVVQKSLTLSLGEKVLIQSSELKEIIANYTQNIGNIEQFRSSQDVTVDPLLRKLENDETKKNIEKILKTKDCGSNKVSQIDDNQFTNTWNTIEEETIPNSYAHRLFEQQVALNPQAIALVYEDEKISYEELNTKANRIAHFLIKEGIKANKVVAIYIERSIDLIVGLLGILKSGAAYLPLDFNYPKKSLQFMFEDSGSDFILSHKKLENNIPFSAKKIFYIEDIINNSSAEFDENAQINDNLDNLGYLIYTSGSTGKSKGVMLPHKALSNLINWHLKKISGKRNVLQFTALSFDMSFIEIFTALGSGGTLALISEYDRLDPWRFSEVVRLHNVQQLILPVSYLKTIASTPLEKKYFSNIKEIITAGEQLIITPSILSFFEVLKSCKLLNYYGPAETHVVTAYTFPEKTTDWPDYPPIGKPISNTKIILLDDAMQPVPPGEVGELCIGGAALADGYMNRLELTNEKFIQDNWGNEDGSKLYKTGDLGQYLPDGNLVFLRRKDGQLKIRGFRIEPNEIESRLIKYPGIKEAVVIAKKDASSEKHLEAFIVIEGSRDDKLINLIYSYLQERIPPQMLPSVFNIIDKMPLTDSGKIDRMELEKYNRQPISYSINKMEEPKTDTEKEIIEIMENMFKLRIGINHSFTSIGGNSLLAMHIVSQLRDRLSVEVPACTIVSDAKIADTARRIDLLITEKNNASLKQLGMVVRKGTSPGDSLTGPFT
jgi:amino acid adenylation domain-containing protein